MRKRFLGGAFLGAALCCSLSLSAQEPKGVTPIPPTSNFRPEASNSTRAVVIGISDYQDPEIPDLRFADRDAEAFANFLRSPGGGSLDGDHLKVLTNEQATAGQVIAELTWLLEESKEGDQAIIYFSGHGDVETKLLNQLGFLLLWDSPAKVYLSGALPVDMLRQVVSTLSIERKTKVFVVVDACRAGKLAGNTVIGTQLTGSQLAQQFSHEQKILSCQPNEYSIEGEQWGGGRGVFSYHLCNGLYGLADDDHDGQVSLFEIGRYLEDRVPKEVSPLSQLPLTVGDKSGALFPVDGPTLATLEKLGTPPASIARVEQRGMLQEVLARADTSVRFWYAGFERTLRAGHFFQPAEYCAEFYFQKLMATESIAALRPMLKRNYAAALQDEAQQTLNEWLRAGPDQLLRAVVDGSDNNRLPDKVFTEKVKAFPRCLDRAAELLGNKHYMYASMKARRYFFEGYLVANSNRNPNNEIGEKAMDLFRQSLQWQAEQPQVYWQMSEIYGYNLLQPDSMESYARLTTRIYPNWITPSTSAATVLSIKYKKLDRAKFFLEQASQIDSNSTDVLNAWATYYYFQKNIVEAERQLAKSLLLDSMDVVPWNNLGYIYLETQRYAVAEPVLKKSLLLDSTIAMVWNNLGVVYLRTGRLGEAAMVLKKAIELDTNCFPAWYNLGHLYYKTSGYAEAEQVLKKAIALDSTFAFAWNDLGVMYLQTRRFAEAEQVLKKAIALDSTHAVAWNSLGVVYLRTGRSAEAEQVLKKAIALDSTNTDLWNNLGGVYLNTHRYAEAEPVFKKAISLDSTYKDAVSNLGMVYFNTGRFAEAEPILTEATVLDSTYAVGWNNLGSLYTSTRRYAEAELVLKKAIVLDSTYVIAWYNLGKVFAHTRRYTEAEPMFKKALKLDSMNASYWIDLGNSYLNTRRYTEAESVLNKAIGLDSTNTSAWANLGTLLFQTRRYDQAIQAYKKTVSLDSTNIRAWNSLGAIYIQALYYTEAEAALTKAIGLDSAFANPRKHLGMVCFKTNRPDEARQNFLKAIAINPNYAPSYLGMACLLFSEGKTAEAIGYVEQAIGKGSTFEQLESDEDLAPLRARPEWKALMKKHFPDQVKD